MEIGFNPGRVSLIERPYRLVSNRSIDISKVKLRAILDRTKLRGSKGDAE